MTTVVEEDRAKLEPMLDPGTEGVAVVNPDEVLDPELEL